ncbi:hypothetical protein GJ744_012451 [Endocarpon pusillum]|uniref:Uncharacterized protein n=1 Tax=Endocarpon pusillum TaxID=364733 RepID=A0A8H7E432_9EURO|nr:hypothetical protein GJ744_012451 [Endocarpon pusillum]
MSIPTVHLYHSPSNVSSTRKPPSEGSQSEAKEARAQARCMNHHVVGKKWRPWTLHPVTLFSTALFTLGIIGILEFLQRYSDANHGIIFATKRDAFSTGWNFLFLTFPTLLAVVYSTWWSWIDLDVKRLQPWFELIGNRTKKACCSLVLEYPVEFLAWVPIRAAKRRQWAVVSASLTMVLVLWVVTPLQSGIFNIGPVTATQNVFVSPPARLLPPSLQSQSLDGSLLNTAYGVTWLGQQLPPFTQPEFALSPFSWREPRPQGVNVTLVANTTLYRADLDCFAPASVFSPPKAVGGTLEVDDGQGCNETTMATNKNGFVTLLCKKYFIMWQYPQASTVESDPKFTARFCKTSYYSQPVQANVSIPDARVLETIPMGPETAVPDNVFNATLFEIVVTKGSPPNPPGFPTNFTSLQKKVPRPYDISEITMLNLHFREEKRGYPSLASILADIAIGSHNLTIDRFVNDTGAIDAASRHAQQLLFALAISMIADGEGEAGSTHPAVITSSLQAIQLVRGITYSVQAVLGMVVLLNVLLAGWYYKKLLPFGSGPNSIAFLIALASRGNFLEYFRPLDREADVVSRLRCRQATLQNHGGHLSLSLDSVDEQHAVQGSTKGRGLIKERARTQEHVHLDYVWPRELRLSTGFGFWLVLCLALAALIFLDTWTRANKGLALPSERIITQQIVLNYLPTIFGTFIEPLLVVVCRYLCFLQPYEDLRNGSAKASRTLLQKYTSLPPQLTAGAAIRHGHFRLASLSFATILANILTIALSGIFVIRETVMPVEFEAVQIHSPTLNRSLVESLGSVEFGVASGNGEPIQILLSNVTAGTSLPPWTTNDRYYLPLNITGAQNGSSNYNLSTLGFEGTTDCTALTESSSNYTYDFSLNSDATQIRFQTRETFPNGTVVQCFPPMGMADESVTFSDGNHPATQIFASGNSAGRNAVETFMAPIPGYSLVEYKNQFGCADRFVGFWVRANITLDDRLSIVNGPALTENLGYTTGPSANTTSVHLEKLVLGCKFSTYSAVYNLTVDPSGQVLNAVELPNSTFAMDDSIANVFQVLAPALEYPGDWITWHNDTRARDWVSFFISKIARSDSLLNPADPLPDATELSYQVSDVIRRLFALTLAVNSDAFLKLSEPLKVEGHKLVVVNRVFLSGTMYKIAVVILCIDIVIILNIYLRIPKPFLPRMPTSIANNVAFFAASQFAQELGEDTETSLPPEEIVRRLKKSDKRFGFGKFVGTDGAVHVGIEREPLVHSLGNLPTTTRRRLRWKSGQV